jgi:hypothetical protein
MPKYLTLVNGNLIEQNAPTTSSGVSSAGLIPALDASGKLDTSLIPTGGGISTNDVTNVSTVSGTTVTNALDTLYAAQGFTYLGVSTITSSTYTLVLADNGKYLRFTSSQPITVTVPRLIFPVGALIVCCQAGAGTITFSPGTGTTLNTPLSYTTRTQFSQVSLTAISTTAFDLAGDLT